MSWNDSIVNIADSVKLSREMENYHSREWFRRKMQRGDIQPVSERGKRKWFALADVQHLLALDAAKRNVKKPQ